MLLIVDDVQAGCGRTGTFFSFEPAGIQPDMVILSKSLSGFGLPFAVNLIARRHDAWSPGEHNGTFRGNNLAFVTATEALVRYWSNTELAETVVGKSGLLLSGLQRIADTFPGPVVGVKGRGLMCGLQCATGELADRVSRCAFRRGLIVETCGPHDEIVKCLPALTTSDALLLRGLTTLMTSVNDALALPAEA
jgi:diaminobutyrate-2-oxoglutarate transaminase